MAMMNLPSLDQLTPDDRAWRVDWFGECGYPGSIRRYAQPSIKLVLSPLRCSPDDNAALCDPDATEHSYQHEAWIPVAALPLLAIGDIWQAGRQVRSPDYQIETFRTLRVLPETTTFVKAGLAIEEHFLLPLGQHPWHRRHTHAYCVAIDLGRDRRLLVPCVEIIRFYFGSSGNLLKRLFTRPLAPEHLWCDKRLNPANKHLHLTLAAGLSGSSASDIGRIAECKFAWRAAAGIHASCQKASAHHQPAYPYTGFPFEGTTDLVASGVWLPFGENDNATFLAYRLRSCSHPFPFHSLSYEATDKKAWHESSGNKKRTGDNSFARGVSNDGKELVETDPGSRKRQQSAIFDKRHRFPDLARKQVWREKIEAMPKADAFLRRADGSLEQVAFGESEAATGMAAGVDVAGQEMGKAREHETLPWFAREGLRIIAADPKYAGAGRQAKVICLPEKSLPVFSLPVVVDEDGELDPALLYEKPDGTVRQRQACLVELAALEKPTFCLIIVEGSVTGARPMVFRIDRKPSMVDVIFAAKTSDVESI